MKICTDIEQSSKLFEIGISIETADMCWEIDRTCFGIKAHNLVPFIRYNNKEKRELFQRDTELIPAWSLAALLGVLPEGIIKNYYVPNLQKENGKYSIAYGNDELLCIADNPVDACYELITLLHKENLI